MRPNQTIFNNVKLNFNSIQAPESLKAIMMAVQNLTVAFGDIIVIILIPILTKVLANQVKYYRKLVETFYVGSE